MTIPEAAELLRKKKPGQKFTVTSRSARANILTAATVLKRVIKTKEIIEGGESRFIVWVVT